MSSGLIFDLVVLSILLALAIFGAVRGFSKMTMGFVSVVGAVIAAWFLHPLVANLFSDWGMESFFSKILSENLPVDTIATALENGELVAGTGLKLPETIVNWLTENNTPEMFATYGVATLSEFLVAYFAKLAVKAIAFLAVFVVAALVIALVLSIFKSLKKISVFGFLDRALGFALGACIGLVVVWGIMLVIMIIGVSGNWPEFGTALETSVVGNWLYNHNILITLLNSIQG